MNKKLKVVFFFIFLSSIQINIMAQQQIATKNQWLKLESFSDSNSGQIKANLKKQLQLQEKDDLIPFKTKTDNLGFRHTWYQQSYQNIPIEGAVFIIHQKAQQTKGNGKMIAELDLSVTPSLDEATALNFALENIKATKYAWDDKTITNFLKKSTSKAPKTIYPKGQLVILSTAFFPNIANNKLAYKFDIFALEPMGRYHVYIDAQNGEVLDKISMICSHQHLEGQTTCSDLNKVEHFKPALAPNENVLAACTGQARYINDNLELECHLTGNGYHLRDYSRGDGIETFDLQNTTNSPVDFFSTSSFWDNTPDGVAVHWGAQQVYDYFWITHGRNSFDGNGQTIVSWVNFGQDFNNAFWNGYGMTFGDGDGMLYTPLVSLDIIGHEMSHGVTQHAAQLNYRYEQGALNESFSDIFGTVIEFYAAESLQNFEADWIIGASITPNAGGIRSLSNPNDASMLRQQPDTYQGNYWYHQEGCVPNTDNDLCGVHRNSGVQNYWFYLLCEGGNGTNDFGYNYSVAPIGMVAAAQIAYRNLTVYLTPNAQYADARLGSLQATQDFFGEGSFEYNQVIEAWKAVGLENEGNCTANSNFSHTVNGLELNLTAHNQDNNATFTWDLGDGTIANNATAQYTHVYSTEGTYEVCLTVTDDCGTASECANITVNIISTSIEGFQKLIREPTIARDIIALPDGTHLLDYSTYDNELSATLAQLNENGTLDWVNVYSDLNYTSFKQGASGLNGTIYLLANNSIFENQSLVHLDDTGNLLDVQSIHRSNQTSEGNYIEAFDISNTGDLFLATSTNGAMKIDAAGTLDWANKIQFPVPYLDVVFTNDVITATNNSLFLVGNVHAINNTVFNSFCFLSKMDVNGNPIWTKTYSLNGGEEVSPKHIIMDASDNLYMGGQLGDDSFLMKTSVDGDVQWIKKLHQFELGEISIINGLATAAGAYNQQAALVQFSSNEGNIIWAKNYGGQAQESFIALSSSEHGEIVAMGKSHTYNNGHVYVVKTDEVGNTTDCSNQSDAPIPLTTPSVFSEPVQINTVSEDNFYTISTTSTNANSATVLVEDVCETPCLVEDCVYPGDLNNDGEVDAWDILELGLFYGEAGPPRLDPTLDWLPQSASSWNGESVEGINHKHVDSDGNGIINQDDSLAIHQNYGLTHDSSYPSIFNPSSLELIAETGPIYPIGNNQSKAEIILILRNNDGNIPVVYGLASNIHYTFPFAPISEVRVGFEQSILKENNTPIQSIVRHGEQNQFEGNIAFGVTRYNHQDVYGEGEIARFFIVIDDILTGDSMELSVNMENTHLKVSEGQTLTLGNTLTSIDIAQPLSIERLNFEAQEQEEHILLEWSLMDNLPSLIDFELQKSTTADQFKTIHQIDSANDNTSIYSYKDKDVQRPQSYYYRLKMNHMDGSISYSPIRTVDLKANIHLVLYPNPVRHLMGIDFSLTKASTIGLQIYNAQGILVQEKNNPFILPKGWHQETVNVSTLERGVYNLVFETNEGQLIKKMVKL